MTMHTLRTLALATISFLLLTGYNSCDPILDNNGFDLWCGDELCFWEVEKGDVERVATWHSGDHGVSMVGDEVSISQFRDIADSDVQCLVFELVAKVDATATATLELDYFDDGTTDVVKQIPTSDWASLTYLIELPPSYQGIRFRVRKDGPGEVVLAQIYADDSEACASVGEPVDDRPVGAACVSGTDCVSGTCADQVASFDSDGICSSCASDSDCTGGDICGAVTPAATHLDLYRGCVAPAGKQLADRCTADDDCDTGVCHRGICSTCRDDSGCTGGASCAQRDQADRSDELAFWVAPYQCDPLGGGAATGNPCLDDADCASGSCAGAGELRVCELDGRRCGGDPDCPDGLACRTIGTAGGQCQ
jgi:hypothetical protein